jgi:hypothetical protein
VSSSCVKDSCPHLGMPSGCLACGAAASSGQLAGQAEQLFQVGKQFAGHLDAIREELAEQLGYGDGAGCGERRAAARWPCGHW